jgi:hypothetical protein
MASAQSDSVSLHGARSAGERFVNTPVFAILSRAGFVARALIYGIIGLLAFELVIRHGGKITNQQGACERSSSTRSGTSARCSRSAWRLLRFGGVPAFSATAARRRPRIERIGALGSGIVYACCAYRRQILTGPGTSGAHARNGEHVFGWPAGPGSSARRLFWRGRPRSTSSFAA